ncbi:MAG: DUF2807 domain-containing protein [Verrucomicrobiota bacterium]|nr:DUF2807 domain-containing protein [Verrucomicrobiota bacterium]
MNTSTISVRPLATLKLATFAALGVALLLLNGCHWAGVRGNGHLTTENRQIAEFTDLQADGAFRINWVAGPAKLSIRTDSNLLEFIRTESSGGKLHLEWTKPLRGSHGITVEVSSAALTRVTLNGATRLDASRLAGSEFYLEANGATRATLSGAVNAMSGELNGASRLDAEELTTKAMEITLNGAGRANVNATDALKVDISGAGTVTYAGNPQISKTISGAGSVRRRN